jgi:hypothetical protein
MSHLPRLPDRIETPTDILEFFGFLTLVDKTSFHPDDRFWDSETEEVRYVDRSGRPAYTPEEAQLRDRLMGEAFDVAAAENLDLYELGLWATSGDLSDAPAWVRHTVESWRRPSLDPSMNGPRKRGQARTKLYDVRWEDSDGQNGYYVRMTPREAAQTLSLLKDVAGQGNISSPEVTVIESGAISPKELRELLADRYNP